MRFSVAIVAALLLALPLGSATDARAEAHVEVTPVQKVTTLLTEMLDKGKQEKHAEQVQFAAYKQFCEGTTVEKQRAVKAADQQIEMLQSNIQKAVADASLLTKEIAKLDEDVSVWTGDSKAASKVREIERADYQAMHTDYSESIDALQRAIAVVKKQAHDRKQKAGAASLAEVSALRGLRLISEDERRAINAFLQQDDPEAEGLAVSAPDAHGYEFQSHGIVEMLEKLLDKFIDERTAFEKEEINAGHAFELLMQDLKAQIEQGTTDRGEKATSKATRLQEKADAEGDLTDTTTTREDDSKYLADLMATCESKASDFESRQQLRSEELQAIEKAIEIISGSAVAGAAEKHLPALLQGRSPRGSSLSQLRSQGRSPLQERAAKYLRVQATHLNSRVLSALAVHVSDDPFSKVKKLIKDLIVRLMEEANEEAEHKGWCDTELATNEQTRKEKTAEVEMLHAEIDELEASISSLTEDLAILSKEVADLDAAMAKATTLRQEEKATNAATVKDAEEAQTALSQALVVLKEFYAKAAEAVALLQRQQVRQVPPPIFDSPYQGMAAEHGGVVGLLEVIMSDFARLQSDTETMEATAQKTYDEFMTDSKVSKAQKSKDSEHKAAKKQDEEQALTAKKSDLEGTQKMLDAALSYYDKLKPSCVDAGVSYDDRVSRRKEEIQSLQEALRILNGEDIA